MLSPLIPCFSVHSVVCIAVLKLRSDLNWATLGFMHCTCLASHEAACNVNTSIHGWVLERPAEACFSSRGGAEVRVDALGYGVNRGSRHEDCLCSNTRKVQLIIDPSGALQCSG